MRLLNHYIFKILFCFTFMSIITSVSFAQVKAGVYYLDRYVENPFVKENIFIDEQYELQSPPLLADVKQQLPQPFWESHQDVIACYWKTWEIAFGNLRQPHENSHFVNNYVTTEFNDHIFMWDHAFMFMYWKYALNAFAFQKSLDNFYTNQYPDGYICREISETNGSEQFHRFDLASTGPNIFPWTEWEYYQFTGDKERLAHVFPVLTAYTQWLKKYHTWQDGTYFTNGWGCGMDNQPRHPEGYKPSIDHGHMSWIDITLQQIFMDKLLLKMADVLGRRCEIVDVEEEFYSLSELVNEKMWNDKINFYVDRYRDGSVSDVKSIGAYWSLLAEVVPVNRLKKLCAHLEDENEFNRWHRIPSLSADTPGYEKDGDYWKRGIWCVANYMTLRGLTVSGFDSLAHEIAMNHIDRIVHRFKETGTIWENYAPEPNIVPRNCRPNFVGFSGVSPISILFENVFGIQPYVPGNQIVWDVRLIEKHGIKQYPFGPEGIVNMTCEKRKCLTEEPVINVSSNIPLTVKVKWEGGSKTIYAK